MQFFVVPLLLGLQATPLPRRPLLLLASPPLMAARPPPAAGTRPWGRHWWYLRGVLGGRRAEA